MRRLVGLAIVGLATLAPTWAHADDDQIAQDILQELQAEKQEGHLKNFGIDLQVEESVVLLKGHVTNNEQQQLILEIARRVPGVAKVINDLDVVPTSATAKSIRCESQTEVTCQKESKSTKAAAGSRLVSLRKSLVKNANSGTAKSNSPEAKSALAVAHVQPVEQIANIEPAPEQGADGTSAAQSDEIVRQIAHRLEQEKQAGRLRGFNVDVQCNEGVVWVAGHVSNAQQHELVIDIARRTPAVVQVVNDLKINGAKNAGSQTTAAFGTGVAKGASGLAGSQPSFAAASEKLLVPPVPPPDESVAPPAANQVTPVANQMEQLAANVPAGMKLVPVPVHLVPAPMQMMPMQPHMVARRQTPLAFAPAQGVSYNGAAGAVPVSMQEGGSMPVPTHMPGAGVGIAPARFDHPTMPGYAWPSYASYPNYAAVTYPKQYSPAAWPYIGPFYPYPQVPLGWRKVTLQWKDGWWNLDFKDK